ncbi:hypoxanthine phosphoribosyltransferase [Planctomicrobium sp. SH664]|uniref:hypoxanthine phosphoribosyltransferase n=1 Tax=Planctomicrobium sp. SH664 TaxID=3448125 RepID=UPI003F5B6643
MSVQPLISQAAIAAAVAELGERISRDYQGKNLTVLGVLTGSVVLVTDLMRQINVPHQVGFIQASSYRGTATSPEELRLNLDWLPDISDRDVLVVDDIFDTGRTLSAILSRLQLHHPRSLQTAVLLWKKERREVTALPDYFCFEIPDAFVVGYGLDFNGAYRHLPYIGVVVDEATPP